MRHVKTAVVLIGRSGCGKGESAKPLRAMNIPVLETGALFRAMKSQANHSQSIDCIDSGKLVSDETVLWQVKLWLTRHKEKMIVLDGAVRTDKQARVITEELKARGYQIATFWFNASAEICQARLTKRANQSESGRIDDKVPTAVAERLREFELKTAPTRPFMQHPATSYKFVEVPETLGIEESQSLIMHSLGLISNARITSMNQPQVFIASMVANQVFRQEPHPVEP